MARLSELDGQYYSGRSGVRLSVLTTLFHLITFAGYVYTLIFDLTKLPVFEHRATYGGRFKFLTFWNLCIQTAYFGYSLLNDLFGSNSADVSRRSTLQIIRDRLAACIVFPCGVLVVLVFWGVYTVDRELIFPKALDQLVPAWLNHAWHSTVIVFLLMEKLLVLHHYPTRISGITTSVLFGLIYQFWIFWIAYASGIWVYPILEVLNWPLRILFLVICWAILGVVYFIGEFLTALFWPGSNKKKYI